MAQGRTRSRHRPSGATGGDSAARAARDSAQKIWLAGLGAFERAKTEGPKMFESLVEQGRAMGARAVGVADDALKAMREAGPGGGRWDKLEQVFEERVSRSLARLGVLTRNEVEELSRQVHDLNETVRDLLHERGKPAAGGAKAGRKKAAPRAKKAAKPRATRGSRARRA